ncbi:MAG: T9SS type A sorting domain-containing protein [Flavobacteriaceae bacterium]
MKNVILLFLFIPLECFAQFGQQQIIDVVNGNPRGVYSVDIDGDGSLDVLCAISGENKIAWYKNDDGLGNFATQRIITSSLQETTTVIAADIDGDNDMDVIATSKVLDRIVWFENLDGLGTFGTQSLITSAADGAIGLYAADLDSDGDMDVLSASYLDNKIAWYENTDGLGTFGPQQVLTNGALSTRDVYAADLDGDGDMDVIAASTADDRVIWFENLDGLGNFGPEKIINNDANGVIAVRAADIDGDGDKDVIAAIFGDGKISWYENMDGLGNFSAEKVVSNLTPTVRLVQIADIDKDGNLDIAAAIAGTNTIVWYENTDGLGTFSLQKIISEDANGLVWIFLEDLDGDTDLDVISASIMDNKIAWYKNLTILGVQESFAESFSVYPNPVKNVLNIAPKSDLKIENINLFDALGRQVFQENGEKATVDFADISNGIYFLKLQTLNSIFTIKIIKE